MEEREERIRRRAHQIWEENGRPDSSEMDFWLQAEKEIDAGPAEDAPNIPPNNLATRLE